MNTHLTSDDDQRWFAALAGKPDGLAGQTVAEGALIRALFLQRNEQLQASAIPNASHIEKHWVPMLEKLRREGILANPSGAVGKVQHSPQLPSNAPWYALVASVSALAFGLAQMLHSPEQFQDNGEIVLRGGDPAQRLVLPMAELDNRMKMVTELLDSQKVAYFIQPLSTGKQLQTKVQPGSNLALALVKQGIHVPPHGRINVVFAERK
jgi:hypothetical protein